MTTQALTHVTLETIENYRVAATQAVAAYRAGGQRLVDAVNGTVEAQLVPRTAKLAPRAAERMDEMRGSVNAIIVKGLDQLMQRTEAAIERGSDVAAAQLHKAAERAAEVENTLVSGGLDTAARLSLPVAKLARAVSGKVAEGAKALADVAGAHPVKSTARRAMAGAKRAVAPAARRAKAQLKTATQRAKSAVAKAGKQDGVQRARRAAKKAFA